MTYDCEPDCAHCWFFATVNSAVWLDVPTQKQQVSAMEIQTVRDSQHAKSYIEEERLNNHENRDSNIPLRTSTPTQHLRKSCAEQGFSDHALDVRVSKHHGGIRKGGTVSMQGTSPYPRYTTPKRVGAQIQEKPMEESIPAKPLNGRNKPVPAVQESSSNSRGNTPSVQEVPLTTVIPHRPVRRQISPSSSSGSSVSFRVRKRIKKNNPARQETTSSLDSSDFEFIPNGTKNSRGTAKIRKKRAPPRIMAAKYADPIYEMVRADMKAKYSDILAEMIRRFKKNGAMPQDWPGATRIKDKVGNSRRRIRALQRQAR